MISPTSHLTLLDTLRLHHLEWAGDNPPIVFLHGFISNAYAASHLGTIIAPQRRLMALDLRGRGESDKPPAPYGINQHIRDLAAWLDAHHLSQVTLVGHSLGATLALFFTHQYPGRVDKLVLFDGGAPPSELAFQMFLAYHQNLTYEYPSIESYIAPYRKMLTLQPWTEVAERLTRANVREQPDGRALRNVPRYVVEAELAALDLEQWRTLQEIYPKVEVPVLLIRAGLGSFGPEDRHLPDEILGTMTFPHLQVYDMPTAGHTSVLTIPDTNRDQALQTFLLTQFL